MWKKTGEIHLCMDYRKLNSITVRDAFPLPRIYEALQAVHSSNWFSSFDLAQGYLQLAMEESDIKKTAFRASSMGLYKFTHRPFGLSNAGSSFCHLMEQCLGDQQFVTLLLYLDDICIFAPTIDEMLDQIQLVFNRLKKFNLKIKPKNVISLALVCCFWAMSYWLRAYQPTQKKWIKLRPGLFLKTSRRCNPPGISILLQAFYSTFCQEGMMPS